jgi:hypothetical protein
MAKKELIFPMADRQHPFQDENVDASSVSISHLRLIGFNGEISPENVTADNIRKRAITLRANARGENGINTRTQAALRWALSKTKDCLDDQEFNSFLLDGCDFNIILSRRLLKRTTS